MNKKFQVRALIHEPDGSTREITAIGRDAETLVKLVSADRRGVTTAKDFPAGWRVSHFILKLRKLGLRIETMREQAGDVSYGRYRLLDRVTIRQPWELGDAA